MNQPASSQGTSISISLHQQRIFTLVFAGLAFVGMIIPWAVPEIQYGFGVAKQSGFKDWGILSLFGIAGAIVAALVGDKTKEFDQMFRYIAIGSFVAVILGAFIEFMQIVNGVGIKTGVGVWICLIAGILGLLWVTGIIKMPPKMPVTSSSVPMPPAPPAPPPPPPPSH